MIVLKRPHAARLFFVFRGSVLPRIAPALATCTALALIVTITHGFLFQWKVTLTTVPFSLIGLALAIFLGFHNNAAYDRFWEARKLCGDLVHCSCSFAWQVQSLLAFDAPVEASDRDDIRLRMIRRTIAFAHALRHQLRDSNPGEDVNRWLQLNEFDGFAVSRLGTDFLLRRSGADLGSCIRNGWLDPRLAAEMDATLSAIAAVAVRDASASRTRQSPLPTPFCCIAPRRCTASCSRSGWSILSSSRSWPTPSSGSTRSATRSRSPSDWPRITCRSTRSAERLKSIRWRQLEQAICRRR